MTRDNDVCPLHGEELSGHYKVISVVAARVLEIVPVSERRFKCEKPESKQSLGDNVNTGDGLIGC